MQRFKNVFNWVSQQPSVQSLWARWAPDTHKNTFNMFDMISHELRAPLSSVESLLDLVLADNNTQLSKRSRKFLNISKDELHRLLSLINHTLNMSHSKEVDHTTHEWHGIAPVVQRITDSLEGLCKKANVTIVKPDFSNIYVQANLPALQQVLHNLLSNAIKYSPQDGVITLEYNIDEENQFQLQVTDQGNGIPEVEHENIFKQFYTLNSTNYPSTGLGLYLARALMIQQGGYLEAIPCHNGGSFSLTLPHWQLSYGVIQNGDHENSAEFCPLVIDPAMPPKNKKQAA